MGLLAVAHPLFIERGGDAGFEEEGVEGFGQVIFGPHLDALDDAFDVVEGGDDDDG